MLTAYSTKTARKQVPAIVGKVHRAGGWKAGNVNLDLGGGPYGLTTEALRRYGVSNIVLDPGFQPESDQAATRSQLEARPADSCTISNVLNVIPDSLERARILQTACELTRGRIYVTVYEGDRSGKLKQTRDGWQANRCLKDWLHEIVVLLGYPATSKNGVIVIPGIEELPANICGAGRID